MTLKELYSQIGGSYDAAISVLRVEKLIDKHIRKFPKGGVVDAVLEAGKTLDPSSMFETAHAMKGVCGNLGLRSLAELASVLSEEFRPGNARTLSDDEVRARLEQIRAIYDSTVRGIAQYEG